jgi:16S rRNA (guanine966-N2)-methyltransferase
MRIIAGTHRGRRIAAPKGGHTRPTGDRVREALFDIVGPVDGASVLDLYAGSGALGLAGGHVVRRDAAGLLRGEAAAGRRHDLVLADPPYDRWDAVAVDLAALLPPVLAGTGLAVVETSARVEPQLPLDLVTSRRYGSARLTVFAP